MEILIDFERVRRLLRDEYRQARAEIDAEGPLAAYARSQERHDQRLATAADAHTLACHSGCAWCCHFTIDLRPVEVWRILRFVASHFDAVAKEALWTRLRANRAITAPLDDMQRMQHNIQCAFLIDNRCSIYAARPQTCRNYHATDVAGCRQSFDEPDNLDIDPEFAPVVYQTGGAHVEAFAHAMRAAGYDVAAYEMNVALCAALDQPESEHRFLAKLSAFPALQGDDVPDEFTDGVDAAGEPLAPNENGGT